MGVIYTIVSPKGKVYVGQSTDFRCRMKSHKHAAKIGVRSILYNSIRKHGWEKHVKSIIEEVADEVLCEREVFWIDKFNSFCGINKQGMNMSLGGDGNPGKWMHDIERRKKASKRFSGKGNPFYGKTFSDETKSVISKKIRDINLKTGKKVPDWGVEKNVHKKSKPIACYFGSGTLKECFSSSQQASIYLGINRSDVSAAASGKQSHANGYVFVYILGEPDNVIEFLDISKFKNKRPVFLLDSNVLIVGEFETAKIAQEATGVPHGNITRGAREQRKLRSGHFFLYKDEYEEYISNQVINN